MTHIIHSSLLALLFYGIYQLFLSNETHFKINRWYLIMLPVISVLLPFVSLPFVGSIFPENAPTDMVLNITASAAPVNLSGINSDPVTSAETFFDPIILYIIYGAFSFLAACVFIYKVSSILELIERGKTTLFQTLSITRVPENGVAFSYFNRVILDEKFDATVTAHIVKHEKVHIEQKHSYDLLYYEILRIVFWFHPVAYLAQRELQKNHEFLVDQQLSEKENLTYQEQLLKITLGCPDFSFLNHYNKNSLLKKRLIMLQKSKSTTSLKKLLCIIPIILVSLLYTACTQDPVVETDATAETIYLKDFKEGQVDFYKGLSEDDIALYEQHKDKSIWGGYDYDFLKTEEGQRFLHVHLQIERNGATYVIEQDNNNQLVKVQERPDGDIMYWDVSDRSEMSVDEYMKVITLTNEYMSKTESEREQMLKELNQNSENDIEIVQEVEPLNADGLNSTEAVPFATVDEVPHFSICSGTQEEIKKCTSSEITKVINENFDTGKFKHLNGIHKINTHFKIDTSGNIVHIKAASTDPLLREEARRVVGLIPQLVPGKADGKEVSVIYSLPITFKIQ